VAGVEQQTEANQEGLIGGPAGARAAPDPGFNYIPVNSKT
jgi:hypothetical protein